MRELGRRVLRNRVALFLLIPIATICSYVLLRGPEWRGVDYVRVRWLWGALPNRMPLLPEEIESVLTQSGFIRYEPVPIRLRWNITMKLDPADLVDRKLITSGKWEQTEWSWIQENLREGDTFLDVGSHHGTYALRAARLVGAKGAVLAVEPNPPTVKRLKENIALNAILNIMVEEVACGDSEGTLVLHEASGKNTGMTSFSKETASTPGNGAEVGTHLVTVVPLDKLVMRRNYSKVSLIKIDTEGAETMVLRGARETLNRYHPMIVVEVIPHQLENLNSSTQELSALLSSFGYRRIASTHFNELWKFDKSQATQSVAAPRVDSVRSLPSQNVPQG